MQAMVPYKCRRDNHLGSGGRPVLVGGVSGRERPNAIRLNLLSIADNMAQPSPFTRISVPIPDRKTIPLP
jgi:hypothetical protein